RNRSDHAGDDASTVRATMGASVASAAEAAVGPSMVEGVEEGSTSFRGTAPSMISDAELGEATATAELNPPSGGVLPSSPRRTGLKRPKRWGKVQFTKQS
ncbi:hypothetical protein THAOC_25246, partial [Thalassiosira oceanica]